MCMTTRGQSRCRHGSGNACDPTRGDRRPGAPKGGRSGRQPREGKGAAAMGETLAAPPGSPPPPFRAEPSRGDEGGGEGVRRPMNPPWFTCPQAGRGGAAMVHPLTKRPATRGGAALPSKKLRERGALLPQGRARGGVPRRRCHCRRSSSSEDDVLEERDVDLQVGLGEERGAAAKARRRRRRGRRSRGRQELENKEEKLKREETRRSRNRRKELQSKTHHPQQQHSKETTQHRGEGGMEPRTPSQHTVDRGVRRV